MNKHLIRIPVRKDESNLQKATRIVLNYNADKKIKFNKFNRIVNYYMEHEGFTGRLNDLLIHFSQFIEKGVDPYDKFKESK